MNVGDNYWPAPLEHIAAENPTETRNVVVAEISTPWGPNSYRHLYTALAPVDCVEELLARPGGIGHEVSTTGPHPAPYRGSFDYEPRFWIWAGETVDEGLEPLVVGWEAVTRSVLIPDQGFLMTYGLVPRVVQSESGDSVHWDDLAKPQHDVVVAKMVSESDYLEQKQAAVVTIDREYLEDYATLRNCSLIQVYYATNQCPLDTQDREVLDGKEAQEFKLPGRLLDIRMDLESGSELIAQVWGVRRLLDPRHSPVLEGRWDYGRLVWPGVDGEVTKERARGFWAEYGYVRDDVLQDYEKYPNRFSIHPESGSVSYGGQWRVSYCRRISRDLIQVEIKKLYEGCNPEVVRHWHEYAVEPPVISAESRTAPNVGTRSKRIVYALTTLGEVIAEIASRVIGKKLDSNDVVRLSRDALDYSGWWKPDNVIPITRQIPLAMGKSDFMERCKDLNSLIVEGISESILRNLLSKLGVDADLTKGRRTLKLLDILVQFSIISHESGLRIISDSQEIQKRFLEKRASKPPGQYLETPLGVLFILYDLRVNASHVGQNIDGPMRRLGIDKASVEPGWGVELDKLYDEIGSALERTTEVLEESIRTE